MPARSSTLPVRSAPRCAPAASHRSSRGPGPAGTKPGLKPRASSSGTAGSAEAGSRGSRSSSPTFSGRVGSASACRMPGWVGSQSKLHTHGTRVPKAPSSRAQASRATAPSSRRARSRKRSSRGVVSDCSTSCIIRSPCTKVTSGRAASISARLNARFCRTIARTPGFTRRAILTTARLTVSLSVAAITPTARSMPASRRPSSVPPTACTRSWASSGGSNCGSKARQDCPAPASAADSGRPKRP